MRRLIAPTLIPGDLGLPPEERKALRREASRLFRERECASASWCILYIIFFRLSFDGAQWLVGAANWPNWAFHAMFWPALLTGFVSIAWIDLWLGFRRAVFEALILRDYAVCPRCGYSRTGLAKADACPECGGDPIGERWDLATVNVVERYKFRQIPENQLPFKARKAVMRRAWRRLRNDNLSFSIYILSLVGLLGTAIFVQFGAALFTLTALGTLGLYMFMESRVLRPHVRAELASTGPAPADGSCPPSA